MPSNQRPIFRQWIGILGILTPILFITLVLVLGAMEPGFNHRTEMMSQLGGVGGARAAAFLLGGGLTGLMLIFFAVGIHQSIEEGRCSKAGPILVALGGLGMIGSAIFHCNPGCTNVLREPTMAGRLHILFAFITGSCLGIAPFLFFFKMKDPNWMPLRTFSLLMGILANIPGLILWGSFLTARLSEWEGLIQRLGLLFPLIWMAGMALHMLRLEAAGAS